AMASKQAKDLVADVDAAIVRAAFALAETDSVLLSDRELHVNALAYLAQHRIVLLDPADIVVNIHPAYHRPEFRDRHYAGSIPIHPPPQISRGHLSTAPKACACFRHHALQLQPFSCRSDIKA